MPSDAALPHSLAPHQRAWLTLVEDYALAYPAERRVAGRFRQFMGKHPLAASRGRREGHLTGSAWLVSADGRRVRCMANRWFARLAP
jgi:hypothetical protein